MQAGQPSSSLKGQDVDEQWRVQIADWRHQLGISSKYNPFDRLKLKIKGLQLTARLKSYLNLIVADQTQELLRQRRHTWQLTGSHRHMSQKRASSKQSECCDHQNVLHPGMLHMSPANHCCTAPLKLVQFLNRRLKNTCVVECIRTMSIYPRVCWQSSMKMQIKIS